MSQARTPLLGRIVMPHTLVVVMILVIVVLAASWVIPSGEYQRVKIDTSEGSRTVTVRRSRGRAAPAPSSASSLSR